MPEQLSAEAQEVERVLLAAIADLQAETTRQIATIAALTGERDRLRGAVEIARLLVCMAHASESAPDGYRCAREQECRAARKIVRAALGGKP